MRCFLIVILSVFIYDIAGAQVFGTSASKLGVYNADAVPAHHIEFEPCFETQSAKKAFDASGNIYELTFADNEKFRNTTAAFRLTYGAFTNFEIGALLPLNMDEASLGMKYKLPFESFADFALLAGINLPLEQLSAFRNKNTVDNTATAAYGLVASKALNEKLSLDINLQSQNYTKATFENHKTDVFISGNLGYFITEGYQLVLGSSYNYSAFADETRNMQALRMSGGITVEKAENFILVLCLPFTVYGKNTELTRGAGFALTIVID